MATLQKNVICYYCNHPLSDKYMLERHLKTSKLCLRIQHLKPMPSIEEIQNIIAENFDLQEFTHHTTIPNTYICNFIHTHFINKDTYITTDKDKFNGKYRNDMTLMDDIGFKLIKKILCFIMAHITTYSIDKAPKIKFTTSQVCSLPPTYKKFFAKHTSYKKTTK